MNPVFGNIQDMAGRPKTIASAASLVLDRNPSKITLTGTATVTSLTVAGEPSGNEGRLLWIWGGASAAVVLTNTASPTVGQMNLDGANITLNENDLVILEALSSGAWRLVYQK